MSASSQGKLDPDWALGALAVAAAVFVIATPLSVVDYPPMVDLPEHAAQTSALRHYLDPTFHFRDQFELHPFAVPYLSSYVVGALLMTVLPMMTAVKIAAGVMLALLPAGLAVLCHGMKKSPLLGVAGLLAVWGPLTNWGFLNFLGALGLFAMVVGLSLLVVAEPTRRRWIALGAALVGLFFTHVFRYPFAVLAMVAAALAVARVGARGGAVRQVGLVALAAMALLGVWWLARPAALAVDGSGIGLRLSRIPRFTEWLTGDFDDPAEPRAFAAGWLVVAAVAIAARTFRRREARAGEPDPDVPWRRRATLVALGCTACSLVLYLVLPTQMGTWWYVFPREANAACYLGLALLPDLPRAPRLRAGLVVALAAAALPITLVTAKNYAAFDAVTADFERVIAHIPKAPKLMYLIFDHRGSNRTQSPFTHLPAYVQAERGGWLSFHFAGLGASPLVYRPRAGREDVVPPPTERDWFATPRKFDVLTHGPFFDWFLVRGPRPDVLFARDPTIRPVAHDGAWWLYHREPAAPP